MTKKKRCAVTDDEPALFDLTPYICEPVRDRIPDPSWDYDSGADDSGADDKGLAPESNLEDGKAAPESTGWLSTYSSKGTARCDMEYYRYSWRAGNRIHHIHIRGGNTGNPVAQQRAQRIKEAIAQKMPASEIISKFLKS